MSRKRTFRYSLLGAGGAAGSLLLGQGCLGACTGCLGCLVVPGLLLGINVGRKSLGRRELQNVPTGRE